MLTNTHTHKADRTQPQQDALPDPNHKRQQVNVPALRGKVQRKTKRVRVCRTESETDQEKKKRLRLPAGKPVLISAGFPTHLLALFNIPVVKRDGLLVPLASERRETM